MPRSQSYHLLWTTVHRWLFYVLHPQMRWKSMLDTLPLPTAHTGYWQLGLRWMYKSISRPFCWPTECQKCPHITKDGKQKKNYRLSLRMFVSRNTKRRVFFWNTELENPEKNCNGKSSKLQGIPNWFSEMVDSNSCWPNSILLCNIPTLVVAYSDTWQKKQRETIEEMDREISLI